MKMLILAAVFATASLAAHAADQASADATLAQAETAEAQAARLGNRWTPTEAALKAAHAARDTQDWATMQAQAATALSLAQRSVEQSHEQDAAWRDAVIR